MTRGDHALGEHPQILQRDVRGLRIEPAKHVAENWDVAWTGFDIALSVSLLITALGAQHLANGQYLYNPATGAIERQWIQGIGSDKAAAPQANLMATVVNGIIDHRLPWNLVLIGVFIVIGVELLGLTTPTLSAASRDSRSASRVSKSFLS
jgi:hypothetical protein